MKRTLLLLLLVFSFGMYAQNNPSESEAAKAPKTNGYMNFLSYGQLIGSENDKDTHVHSLQMTHNYQVSNRVALGVETGIDWFDISLLSVGPNVKLLVPQKGNSGFYFGGSLGHVFPLEDMKLEYLTVKDTKGGPYAGAKLGYLLHINGKYNLFMSLGYRYQAFSIIREDWWLREVERSFKYNRFEVRVGLGLF
ncbi:hypothetical protein [Marinilabilia sp.]